MTQTCTELPFVCTAAPHSQNLTFFRNGLLVRPRPGAIVYQTDANADPGVKVVATFPESSHAPIVYPFALVKGAKGEAPAKFLAFLSGPDARPIFEKQGFVILKR